MTEKWFFNTNIKSIEGEHFAILSTFIKLPFVFLVAVYTGFIVPDQLLGKLDEILVIIEACIGVLGIQDICHFTSRDIGYFQFYFQGYGILCSIFGLLSGILNILEN